MINFAPFVQALTGGVAPTSPNTSGVSGGFASRLPVDRLNELASNPMQDQGSRFAAAFLSGLGKAGKAGVDKQTKEELVRALSGVQEGPLTAEQSTLGNLPTEALQASLLKSKLPDPMEEKLFNLKKEELQFDKEYKKQALAVEKAKIGSGGDLPSAIREYQYYNQLSPEAQKEFLNVKRAQQTLNLGGAYGILGTDGTVTDMIPKTLPPEKLPENVVKEEAAKKEGAVTGEKAAVLKSMQANMPQLKEMTAKLGELAEKATYTLPGKATNYVRGRVLGLEPNEGAIAATKYDAMGKTEIIPLLRETFGAQFTEKDREALQATLTDPTKTPKEKQGIIEVFIAEKERKVKSLEAELNAPLAENEIQESFVDFDALD